MHDEQTNAGPEMDCRDSVSESERLGNQYYRSFLNWLSQRRRSDDDARRLLGLARSYDRALEFLIRCVDRLRLRSERLARKRANAAVLRSHLRKDIDFLEKAQGEES